MISNALSWIARGMPWRAHLKSNSSEAELRSNKMKIDMTKKYRTRAGDLVRILATDVSGGQPVMGLIGDDPTAYRWSADGRYQLHAADSFRDLFEVADAPEPVKIYAAACHAGFTASENKTNTENCSKRAGPVVEVTLPRDPPKEELAVVSAFTMPTSRHVEVAFSDGSRTVLGAVKTDQAIALQRQLRKSTGLLVWVSDGSKPREGQLVLADTSFYHGASESTVRKYQVCMRDGHRWRPQRNGSYLQGFSVRKWAYFNLEN